MALLSVLNCALDWVGGGAQERRGQVHLQRGHARLQKPQEGEAHHTGTQFNWISYLLTELHTESEIWVKFVSREASAVNITPWLCGNGRHCGVQKFFDKSADIHLNCPPPSFPSTFRRGWSRPWPRASQRYCRRRRNPWSPKSTRRLSLTRTRRMMRTTKRMRVRMKRTRTATGQGQAWAVRRSDDNPAMSYSILGSQLTIYTCCPVCVMIWSSVSIS